MRKLFLLVFTFIFSLFTFSQAPKTYTSSEILLQMKKLNVLGSVLYIAAHPDDENTRLLAYLANEKLYRTGYMSLTRGDGGQNLIGDEQGIDLGLIRTQELLSARRIDGAEQFFSRAYDFGFCKTPEEALKTWGHDKILSDVVWVIRKFRPDVIITRFPEDSRAGHGHHSASAILAREAFDAAADSTKFPEQLKQGVTVWQAKRILWNTYNFGGNNTQSEDQLKIDCGGYNALLGKSYGEIAALSRSQHKSQGFGVPAQRGELMEYFATIKGDKPAKDLMDGINTKWSRVDNDGIEKMAADLVKNFSTEHPENSVNALIELYKAIQQNVKDDHWKEQKLKDIRNLIEACSGLFLDATTNTQYAVQGDSLAINFMINNRLGTAIRSALVNFKEIHHSFDSIKNDIGSGYTQTIFIRQDEKLTQPYWLDEPMEKGSFNVSDQQLIGKAENDPISAEFIVNIDGLDLNYKIPVRYKYTDPVKGEKYQPLSIVPRIAVNITPAIVLYGDDDKNFYTENFKLFIDGKKLDSSTEHYNDLSKLSAGGKYSTVSRFDIARKDAANGLSDELIDIDVTDPSGKIYKSIKEIEYDHIPSIKYFTTAKEKILLTDLKTDGKSIGYIVGAGDKVPPALEQMGYKVILLKEKDITSSNLKQFNAIVTGVRAYNVNDWLNNDYDILMEYVKNGGVLLVQYNTNNGLAPLKNKIGPYPFTVTTKRITDETAKVNFLLPKDSSLNYPNKITDGDFNNWIQERSIYDAENIDSHYKRIFSMQDPNEAAQDGSLIIADYGKGKFIYTGIVFFRELPAGVPGAYRLFANLLASPKPVKK